MNMKQALMNAGGNEPELRSARKALKAALTESGWVLLRNENYDVAGFSQLMASLCRQLTYDPARENITEQSQKVDAGTQAVGLHIENGTAPLPPDIIAFFSALSAAQGSQTTLCDGHLVWLDLPDKLKAKFSEPMSISRHLPKSIWQKYVAAALKINAPEEAGWDELQRFAGMIPGQSIRPADGGAIEYRLRMNMIRHDNLKGVPAFANALLGPSYNYEKPRYHFADGEEISPDLIAELAGLCERHTAEIAWQDGDLAIIDNKRFMHGRREILVPLEQRKLYISMGLGINNNF